MNEPKILLNHSKIALIIRRFALQIAENNTQSGNVAIIGLQPRGVELSRRVMEQLNQLYPNHNAAYGELDNSFHRDDVGHGQQIVIPKPTKINFSTLNKNIILIDDVLYTGRTVRASLDAIMDFGRPQSVQLMVLIDRRFNRELPIAADYVGTTVDSRSTGEKVKVEWVENDNKVWLLSNDK